MLRAFSLADAPAVSELAGDRAVAATTILIPHPYPPEAATEWISRHAESFASGQCVNFAVTDEDGSRLVGSVALRLDSDHSCADLGYWIGTPYWGRGYATEAARATLDYAFGPLGLNRVEAHHFSSNPASRRVLEKIGMRLEGTFRQRVRKWGEVFDTMHYGILREDAVAGCDGSGAAHLGDEGVRLRDGGVHLRDE